MKKLLSVLLVLVLCLALCACGKEKQTAAPEAPAMTEAEIAAETAATENAVEDFPFVGTWSSADGRAFLRVRDDGTIQGETVSINSMTSTVNGVTTTSNSKTVFSMGSYTWNITNGSFMFNGVKAYTPSEENGQYILKSDVATYYRVGDLDYVIALDSDDSTDKVDLREAAQAYALGTVIQAEGFELVLTEVGIRNDIRITSKSSGIQITSGPSAESGKQYVYLQGTLKNTATTATRAAIGGTIYLDEYEFNLKTDTIGTDGAPSSAVDPLETVHILLYAQISDEMAGIFTDGKIVFGFNDNFANVQVDQADYLYYVDVVR